MDKNNPPENLSVPIRSRLQIEFSRDDVIEPATSYSTWRMAVKAAQACKAGSFFKILDKVESHFTLALHFIQDLKRALAYVLCNPQKDDERFKSMELVREYS